MGDGNANIDIDTEIKLQESAKVLAYNDQVARELLDLVQENAALKVKLAKVEAQLKEAMKINGVEAARDAAVKKLSQENERLRLRAGQAEDSLGKIEEVFRDIFLEDWD